MLQLKKPKSFRGEVTVVHLDNDQAWPLEINKSQATGVLAGKGPKQE